MMWWNPLFWVLLLVELVDFFDEELGRLKKP